MNGKSYSEVVAELQQKVVSEEIQAVQEADRDLTAAELHRKELVDM